MTKLAGAPPCNLLELRGTAGTALAERRLLVSHDPVFLRFAKIFFTQSCFGCGADLELE